MQIKKLLKFLPVTVIAAGLAVAAIVPSLSLLNNPNYLKNQIFNVDQAVDETEHTDQLEYIINDVTKQTGVTNSVASIKLSNNSSSLSYSSAAIVTKTDGSTLLYMWGQNDCGQLGFTANSTANPIPNNVIALSGKKITQIALGYDHSAALLEDGSLYTWGNNDNGQLGNGSTGGTESTPTLVDSTPFGSKKITKIALGYHHFAALLEDGSLYMWGSNQYGQLGNGSTGGTESTPTLVDSTPFGSKKITGIALGEQHSAAFLEDGSLYMWGFNGTGQVGDGTSDMKSTPTLIAALSGKKIAQIALGSAHSAALLEDGSLYMWGYNEYGQLGDGGSADMIFTPIEVTINSVSPITQIALGGNHSAALLEDGSLYMWGPSVLNGTNDAAFTPTLVTALSGKKIAQIALGFEHSTALLDDGNLYTWGNNNYGQLGNAGGLSTPTWMSKLGKDSHITTKSTITARNAVDNLWVDNKFNLAGFKNIFDLVNIPDVTDQTYEIGTRPTYNNRAGTVTMNIKIKYYYDENGLIIANTAATPMIFSGFTPGPNIVTNITAKTAPLSSIVVDKWLSYVTVDEKINRTKLEEFLTLTDVPADAEFTIAYSDPIIKTGVLTFIITSSKCIDDLGNVLNSPSDPFSITLNLAPRITKMTPKASGYPADLTPTALKAKLFDNNGLVKDINELNKYLTIVAPVDGVQYHLVDNKWDANDGDGTVKFAIYASKYYDTNATEQTGSSTIAASKVDFDLSLQRELSTITVKANMPNVRVDNFKTYVESNGTTVATSKLEEFFDLTNIPSDATFSIANVKIDAFDANFTTNHLTFDLTINQFNQGSPATPATYTHNYGLTLDIQHQQTVIKAKSTYDKSIRVDKVANELNTLSGPALVTYLNNYLDMQSIPVGATITLGNITPVDDTGILTFDVIPSQIYNANSDLIAPSTSQFNITLQFGFKHAPTSITIKSSYAKTRVDQFANNVNTLKGLDLYNYLVPNYVSADSVDATKLTAEVVSQDNANGKITTKLSVSQYYDANSNLVDGILEETLVFELTPIHILTNIKELPTSVYPQDLTAAQFKQRLKTDGATVAGEQYTLSPTNITFMKKFLIIEFVPNDTVFTLTFIPQTYAIVTTPLSFNLQISKYYDANGDLKNNSQDYNGLTLNLMSEDAPTIPKTEITTKPDAEVVETPTDFLKSITNADGTYNLVALSKYIDGLNTLPIDGNVITIIEDGVNPDGTANFTLKVSEYYNGTGSIPQPNGEYKFTVKTNQVAPTSTEDSTGLTVGLVIGGVVLVLLLVGLYIWNKKRIQAAGETPDGKDGKAKESKQAKKEAKAEKSKQAKDLASTEVKTNDSIKIAKTEGSLDQTNIANPAQLNDHNPIELGENKNSAEPTSGETKSDKAAKTSETKSLSPNKTTNIDKPKSNSQATKKLNVKDDHKKSSQQTSSTAKNDKATKTSKTKSLSPNKTTNIDKPKSNPQATKKLNASDDRKKSSQQTSTEAKNDKTAKDSKTKSLSPDQTTSKNTNIDKQKSNPQATEKFNASDDHKPESVNETKPIDEAKAKDFDKKN